MDHLVPLTEAWDSGASAWTSKERQDYANDPGDARALIAVSAASNRSKSDQDPATWQPPAAGYRCAYATDWIAIKTRWELAIDNAERAALTDIVSSCPNSPVEVTLAAERRRLPCPERWPRRDRGDQRLGPVMPRPRLR
ncbi:HNH endonuclease family protein [Streptomyces justiciae]|uniref:HNH endonuclease family protein n=1 Tax=Streptomyces justiciae TaxID=2780140 RepID=UPI001880FB5D|nr:HNH endonuclease [Streptomyces justiciae]